MDVLSIDKAIPAVMAEMAAVGKNRTNPQQGYSYRGIDDVYNALQKVMAKYGVYTVPYLEDYQIEERTSAKGSVLFFCRVVVNYTIYAQDGSSRTVRIVGLGMDSGDKGINKALAVAHKYCLLQLFCIPTDEEKDPEAESPEVLKKEPMASSAKQEKPAPEKVLINAKMREDERVLAEMLNKDIENISLTSTMAELKRLYSAAYSKYIGRQALLDKLVQAKNKRKEELLAKEAKEESQDEILY